MPPPSAKNIVQLRQMLAEKFPGVRMTAGHPETLAQFWSTGVSPIDHILGGGLRRGALNEISSSGSASGSALLLAALVSQAHRRGEWIALVDSADSFDPTALENEALSRLLWVRCDKSRQGIKAVDLVLRDGTIPVVVLDLLDSRLVDLRKVNSSSWFRFERIVENSSTALAIFTPEPMISNARARIALQPRFTLNSLDTDRETLLAQLLPRTIQSETPRKRLLRTA